MATGGSVKVTTNFTTFATKMYGYAGNMDATQRATFRRSADRMDQRLERAKRNLSTTGRLSRVGRATGPGRRVGGELRVNRRDFGQTYVQWSPSQVWGLVDSSLNGRKSQAHTISPQPRKNRRPISPAKKYNPSLLFRAGPRGSDAPVNIKQGKPFGVIHPGSTRKAEWRDAVREGQRNIVEVHKREFYRSIANGFGR